MFQIVTFYKFLRLTDLAAKRELLAREMRRLSVKGTIILAEEGFNSTVCGKSEDIDVFLKTAERVFRSKIDVKSSFHDRKPFRRVDVKIKPEIVTLKQKVEIAKGDGTHVEPQDWNKIISDPETIVLDARNHYEVLNGNFPRAVDPKTLKFSELPEFVEKTLDPTKHKRIAMYCTGGIRCEKFAPYLKAQGFESVFQLRGGILKYLETIPSEDSMWQGECFVFDDRVTVNPHLKKGIQPDHSLSVASK
jgi:UPF0176 protein